jgi:cation diffusion facilitator family transporter
LSSSDLKEGGSIAQKAFLAVLAVGAAEIVVASVVASVALLADGIHSVAASTIFLIVWIGLRLSGRSPDGTFHFGYYRIEALGSLFAAFILSVFGGFIILEAYRSWIAENTIANPQLAIISASVSAAISMVVSFKIERASEEFGSAALRIGGLTGVIDVLSSVAVVIGVVLANYFGILHADSIAGILIAGAIFVGAYSIFKEASLVLVDACKCGDVVNAIGEVAKNVKGIKEVHSIRLRQLGSYLTGDMHIVVDNDMIVKEADEVATEVEEKIKEEFENVIDIKVRIESDDAHNRHPREINIKKDESNSKK